MTPTNERVTSVASDRIMPSQIPGTGSSLDSDGYAAFLALFESSAEALIVINSEGIIEKTNRCARELLGRRGGTLLGKNLETLLSGGALEELKLQSGGHTFMASPSGLDAALPTRSSIRVTLRSVLPGSQHLLLFLPEIPTASSLEPNAQQLEAELRTVLDSVQSGALILDSSGRFRFSNSQFGQLLGIDRAKLEQIENFEALTQLLAGRFREPRIFAARWKAFLAGDQEPSRDELELLRPTARVLERFSRPVAGPAGQPVGWLEIYKDVTEHRQIQSHVLQTEKMVALGQVVSAIAHELNNPLTSIMGYVQLMLGHGLPPGPLAEARRVYQEAERTRRIVKNLLYFARENKPQRSIVDLNEIIERTLALRSYELKVEDIAVETDFARDLPKTMADPYQLQQVVLNLLMNAEQALLEARGRGRVHIRTRYLARKSGGSILFEVSDDGPGIPREVAPRIFDPFFTTKGPGVGTGLGLSIVYGIVRQHEGEVTFQNQPGSGAKFTIELPVVPVPAGYRDQKQIGPASRFLTGKPARILVVEDEPTVAQLIVDVLQEEHHRVDAVLDAREGLNLLSRRPYDLVICDLKMPRLDGRAFFRSLVRTGNPMRRRILFITGDTLAPATLQFLKPNRLPYLAKPFLVEELKLAVRHQIDIHRRHKKAIAARARIK